MLALSPSYSRNIHLCFLFILFTSWFLLALFPTSLRAADGDQIVYVDVTATGANDGSSWQDAYTNLRDALTSAQDTDTLWVASGVYYTFSTVPADLVAARTTSFHIPGGVEVYGGFAGGETSIEQRDWQTNLTILSGDLDRNDIVDSSGIITDTDQIAGTNTRNVVSTTAPTTATTVLDGVIVTGGLTDSGDSLSTRDGAGMQNIDASPTVRNVTFIGNYSAGNGGGMANSSTSPSLGSNATLINVKFISNAAHDYGGGLYNWLSAPTLTDVTFTNNMALDADGGGMYTSNTTTSGVPKLHNVAFTENNAFSNGGGLVQEGGPIELTNVTFTGNTSEAAGGFLSGHHASLTNVTFTNNAALMGGGMAVMTSTNTLTNVNFIENGAFIGGGMAVLSGTTTLSNTTFSENVALVGGGMAVVSGTTTLTGGIFTNNISMGGFGGGMVLGLGAHTLADVSFTNNSATDGGAIYKSEGTLTLTNGTFTGNTALNNGGAMLNERNTASLTNVLFTSNVALGGGGLYNAYSNPTITNATFAGNAADDGGAIYNLKSDPTIRNSIVWGNSSSIENDGLSPTLSNSLIEGCKPGGIWQSGCGSDGGNNLADTDPLFINPIDYTTAPTSTGNVRLQPGSPAIDAGDSGVNALVTDLDGKPRSMGLSIDLGAYEREQYAFNAHTVGKGSVVVAPSKTWYDTTDTIVITATAQPGWSFAGWSGDLSGTALTHSLAITSTTVVTATFTNDPPTADAGADGSVAFDTLVTLDGSASHDADPTQTLTFGWRQTAGTAVVLSDVSAAQPTFTAPNSVGLLTFTLVVTDSLGRASAADSVTISVFDPTQRLYLPVVMNQQVAPAPNLVVTALQGDANGISLVIRNTGTAPTTAAFWVDVYINPEQVPEPHMLWQDVAPAGAVWGVTRSLAPGESVTLTRTSKFYAPNYSAGSFEAGAVLYAIVDSYHPDTPIGAVRESNEQDNRFGPVRATAPGSANASVTTQALPLTGLPPR